MIRALVAIVVGTAVTFSLLWVMHFLIATGQAAMSDERRIQFVDFVRVPPRPEQQVRETRQERPPPVAPRPPEVPQRQSDPTQTTGTNVPVIVTGPGPQDPLVLTRGGFFSDGDYMPIVQVAPNYPRRALERGQEGYVTLEFTVTRQGTVRDPRVVDSTSSVFDQAALDAVSRFRYRPRVIDGEPIEVPGVRFRISFQLEGGRR